MMLLRLYKSLFILLFLCTSAFAGENLVDFEETSISVTNEIIRKIRKDVQGLIPRYITIADGDVTPAMIGTQPITVFTTSSNTGATAITTFDNVTEGQIIILIGGSAANSSTLADGAVFFLTANFTAGLNDSLILYYNGSVFIQLSVANN